MTASKIEWTDRSDWNPIRGCTRVSPGCGGPGDHGGCYAEGIAARFSGAGQPFEGFAHRVGGKPRWTGKVELIENRLLAPLSWRKPARVFACSMSDLFHEALPDEAIDRVFAVMALCPHLTFQVLTKRPERMRRYASDDGVRARVWNASDRIACAINLSEQHPGDHYLRSGSMSAPWPLPNVWLGTSVEDQQRADERIPHLLATPAAKRFLSCEPLLGPIDVNHVQAPRYVPEDHHEDWKFDALCTGSHYEFGGGGDPWSSGDGPDRDTRIDWVIAGGESGPGARPMHPDWARGLRDQCQGAGVPFFFKQWGEWAPCGILENGQHIAFDMQRIGKKAAGAMLDGREWREMPA